MGWPPFNRMAQSLGLPLWQNLLDLMTGDLTLVMDTPAILGIPPDELHTYRPRHPQFFHAASAALLRRA